MVSLIRVAKETKKAARFFKATPPFQIKKRRNRDGAD
jgi:hypothetical protein